MKPKKENKNQDQISHHQRHEEAVQTPEEDVADVPMSPFRFKRIDGRDSMKYEDVADK